MTTTKQFSCQRGDVFKANLEPVAGSEQGGIRPVLVVQNNRANDRSPVTIVLVGTTQFEPVQARWPMNILLTKGTGGLKEDTLILGNQIRTLSINDRLIEKWGQVGRSHMEQVDAAIADTVGLTACPGCGYPNHPSRAKCSNCKRVIRNTCAKCTKVYDLTFAYCPHCGQKKGGGSGV